MSSSPYAYQYYLLQSLLAEFNLPTTRDLAQAPGVRAVIRVTCHYPHLTPPNSVATLTDALTQDPMLTVAYEGNPNAKQSKPANPAAVKSLTAALSRLRFDKLDDQPGIPASDCVLWLVERAAGGFIKGVLLAPDHAESDHAQLVTHLQNHLPTAINPLGGTVA
ncbi:MAG: hypothetical protein AAF125_10340 [Chloroflexota bacterium]